MARITVEDCLEKLPNRFSLVLASAQRTKQLLRGASTLIENEGENKEVVTALREIAAGSFEIDTAEVVARDEWLPYSARRPQAPVAIEEEDDYLPPEA